MVKKIITKNFLKLLLLPRWKEVRNLKKKKFFHIYIKNSRTRFTVIDTSPTQPEFVNHGKMLNFNQISKIH